MSTTDGGTKTTILRDPLPPGLPPNPAADLDLSAKKEVDGPDDMLTERCKATDKAADLLDEAKKIVTGARRQSYGNPEDNFLCIAALWSAYRRRRIEQNPHLQPWVIDSHDVAQMMILMKTARLAESPDHHDSLLDIAGYAACAARLQP